MNNFEKNIVTLIKSALDGGKPELIGEVNFEEIYRFAQKRQITPLIYYGAENIDGFIDTKVGKNFLQSTVRLSYISDVQRAEIENILDAFDKSGISYMKLKGTVLKVLYPHPEMRLMGDADILIKEKEYKTIKPIMEQAGFTEYCESDHEHIWNKDKVSIELHKRLIPSYNKDYYAYFGDGWRLATRKNDTTNEYYMSDEDCFIYLFAHFAKHYRDAGIGVKHITDFYVYMKKYPTLDFEYIEKELEKLQLLTFWKNTKKLLDVWFNGAESDDISDFMTGKIFASGTYGIEEDHIYSEAVKISKSTKNVKVKKFFSLMFPPFKSMCQKYRFLKKIPILLPFMWIVRIFEVLLFKRKNIAEAKGKVDKIDSESVEKYQRELNFVGLDFNFK